MSSEKRMDVLKQISQVAAKAGMKGMIDDDGNNFVMPFVLPEGRSQMVYARPTGITPDDKTIITFFSPCLIVKKGFFAGFSKEQALDLLRRNEQIQFARYGIWEEEKKSMVVASADQILETLDPDEIKTTGWYVAIAADRYEREHGQDQF